MNTTITGIVIRGSGNANRIGFPTVNLEVAQEALPAPGIYAVEIALEHQICPGVAHIGPRPTHHLPPSFEVHCFDSPGAVKDGTEAQVMLKGKIRDIVAFESEDKLKEAIANDVIVAKKMLQ